MASLLPGFEYDIFISYRQKDNKGDKWVSRFVESLKTELETTFKEDISVYFDENPHDRLQETHNVDKSLEGKLKCLIFIPILSQTYCDPTSYAWQYEFLAFLRMAEDDRFGRDVRLRSGNVASRILPVRIHDLEQEDIKLFEKETGSVLRAMDFVFKTGTGAIRPLLPNEDHPNDNLYKTFYRDQISKVAIAIKEIVLGMKSEPVTKDDERGQVKESVKEVKVEEIMEVKEKPAKVNKMRLLLPIVAAALLIIAGIIAYPKIFKKDTLKKLRTSGEKISVVVMPFQNSTNDATWNIYQNIAQQNLTTYLSNYYELKVIEPVSVNTLIQSKNFTSDKSITSSDAGSIAKKLGTDVFIHGSIQQAGTKLRVSANLIDTKTLVVLNSVEIDGPYEEEAIFDITDSLRKKITDYLLVSRIIKETGNVKWEEFMWQVTSRSPEALKCFTNGYNAFLNSEWKNVINWHRQALAIDSNIIWAKVQLAYAYQTLGNLREARKWSQKLYDKVDQMSPSVKLSVEMLYARLNSTPYEEINLLKKGLEIEDKNPETYDNIGFCYNRVFEYDKAIPYLEKALEICHEYGVKPLVYWYYERLGIAYHNTGQYKKEKNLYKKAEQDFPDNVFITRRQAILALAEGNTVKADDFIEKYKSIYKERSATEATIAGNLAGIYSEAGILDKAEEYHREAYRFEANSDRMNTLAYFLIDKDRNINEGLKLVDTLLKSSPTNISYLHTQGWGLYKQGKYQEALVYLQKSWDLRLQNAVYYHEAFLHLEAAKNAVASQKQNN